MDMDAMKETAIADLTLGLGGVALASQPRPTVFWQRMLAAIAVSMVMEVQMGTEDPV